jgi:uncharacterized lipoprotein YehR (DUF1307 family)
MSLRSIALLFMCVVLTACSKVNQENYSKLSAGTWGDQKSFISVQYAGDKVLMFSGQGLK